MFVSIMKKVHSNIELPQKVSNQKLKINQRVHIAIRK